MITNVIYAHLCIKSKMTYFKKIEYEIVMEDSFSVIRSCAGCNKKTSFKNTKQFRINANGNKLDVWLIYQCETCKHTLNLTVYERKQPTLIPSDKYKLFLNNDDVLAKTYGRDLRFFKKNKAEIDFQNIKYYIEKRTEEDTQLIDTHQLLITIQNPYCLKIRSEKQIAEVLNMSRNRVKKLIDSGEIKIVDISAYSLSIAINDSLAIESAIQSKK